jgi:SAM-dependent methyltransferase
MKRLIKKTLFYSYILHHRLLHRIGVLPFDRDFGSSRGTPIGRYYVEKFLRENADRVRGRCLEFGDARYKALFTGAEKYEVVNIKPGPGVDYVCDIHDTRSMPQETFDTIICTQVFEHLAWPEKAAVSLYGLLRPGGLLLLTAPFLNPVHGLPADFRRFTPGGLDLILRGAGFVMDSVDFGGNSSVGLGSLLGMVTEDFTTTELDVKDPVYPYNCLLRGHRPAAGETVPPAPAFAGPR